METRSEDRRKLQTPALVALVVALHVVAVGSVALIQGCGTVNTRPRAEAPIAPLMPPQPESIPTRVPPRPVMPPPAVLPPVTTPSSQAVTVGEITTYEVRRGDNLSTIARRHGVSTAELVALNQLKDANSIRIGQKLMLPPHARVGVTAPAEASARATTTAPAPGSGATHVIQAGDNLSSIASKHGVTVAQIVAANQLADPNRIRVGQSLVIPTPAGAAPVAAPAPAVSRPVTPAPVAPLVETPSAIVPAPAPPALSAAEPFPHVVRMGDSIDSLARDFSVLQDQIIQLNNLSEDSLLRPGQTILIPNM